MNYSLFVDKCFKQKNHLFKYFKNIASVFALFADSFQIFETCETLRNRNCSNNCRCIVGEVVEKERKNHQIILNSPTTILFPRHPPTSTSVQSYFHKSAKLNKFCIIVSFKPSASPLLALSVFPKQHSALVGPAVPTIPAAAGARLHR